MGMLDKMPKEFDPEQVVAEFDAMTKDAERVQLETLEKILQENGRTEYLQKWGLDGRTDPESFKALVPIASHEDLEPYINRIVDGDSSPILTQKPITTISLRFVTAIHILLEKEKHFFTVRSSLMFLQLWYYPRNAQVCAF